LAVTVILFGLVVTRIDLKPHVDENFFFSTSDPQLQESKKIDELFPARTQLILSVSSSNICGGPACRIRFVIGGEFVIPHQISTRIKETTRLPDRPSWISRAFGFEFLRTGSSKGSFQSAPMG